VRHERRRQINRKFLQIRSRAQRVFGDRYFHKRECQRENL
jgi:hypothetical protein